jgi:hypothetical protein
MTWLCRHRGEAEVHLHPFRKLGARWCGFQHHTLAALLVTEYIDTLYLIIGGLLTTTRTTCCSMQNLYIFPHGTFMLLCFYMLLLNKTDYFPEQHSVVFVVELNFLDCDVWTGILSIILINLSLQIVKMMFFSAAFRDRLYFVILYPAYTFFICWRWWMCCCMRHDLNITNINYVSNYFV